MIKKATEIVRSEIFDLFIIEMIRNKIRKLFLGQSRFKQYAEKLYVKHYADRSRTPRRSTNSPSETSVSDDLGSGNA